MVPFRQGGGLVPSCHHPWQKVACSAVRHPLGQGGGEAGRCSRLWGLRSLLTVPCGCDPDTGLRCCWVSLSAPVRWGAPSGGGSAPSQRARTSVMGSAGSEGQAGVCLPRNLLLMKSPIPAEKECPKELMEDILTKPPQCPRLLGVCLLGWRGGGSTFQSRASAECGVWGPWGPAEPQSSSRVSEKPGQPRPHRWQGFHLHAVWLPHPTLQGLFALGLQQTAVSGRAGVGFR